MTRSKSKNKKTSGAGLYPSFSAESQPEREPSLLGPEFDEALCRATFDIVLNPATRIFKPISVRNVLMLTS